MGYVDRDGSYITARKRGQLSLSGLIIKWIFRFFPCSIASTAGESLYMSFIHFHSGSSLSRTLILGIGHYNYDYNPFHFFVLR